MFSVEYFADDAGVVIFDKWLDKLPDKQAIARINTRIERLKRGAFGDCKPLHEGVWELRIDYGAGYRIYYSVVGKTVVLLLCAGDKRKQNADIEKAVYYLNDYKRRKTKRIL
jgi:putative addiction module killer protein